MMSTPYQVDYTHVVAGKHFSSTKRRVRFVFGFSSDAALRLGCKGPDCRGDEHEVVLVWSCASGKQLVQLNGEQIYRNTQRPKFGGNLKFEHTFYLGGHVMVLSGEVSLLPFLDSAQKFDLKLDGQSFFEMKKIYELGEGLMNSNAILRNNVRSDEENLVRMAQQFSLQEVEIQLAGRSRPLKHQSSTSQPNLPTTLNGNRRQGPYKPALTAIADQGIPPSAPFQTSRSNNIDPSFHPQQEPTIMSFMKPPKSPANESAGLPNEVHVIGDEPSYQTPLHKKQINKPDTEVEPWEELVDFASLKDGEESVLFESHEYFDYYNDYVKRGGEAISHPTAPQPSAPPVSNIPVTISYHDPFANRNINETHLGYGSRVRSYTAPDGTASSAWNQYNGNLQNHNGYSHSNMQQNVNAISNNAYSFAHDTQNYQSQSGNYGQSYYQGAQANYYATQNMHVTKPTNIAKYYSTKPSAQVGGLI